jgi:hypothetical protein
MLPITMIGVCPLVPETSTSAQLHRKAVNLRAQLRANIVTHLKEGYYVSSLLDID